MRVSNTMLKMQKDKQVDMGKTSLLELNGVNMSYCSAKEAIINELEECFLLLLKDPWYNIRTISSCLTREETMNDFWSLGISSHGKEEIWFVKVSANGHSILKQLGYKSRTFCKGVTQKQVPFKLLDSPRS